MNDEEFLQELYDELESLNFSVRPSKIRTLEGYDEGVEIQVEDTMGKYYTIRKGGAKLRVSSCHRKMSGIRVTEDGITYDLQEPESIERAIYHLHQKCEIGREVRETLHEHKFKPSDS